MDSSQYRASHRKRYTWSVLLKPDEPESSSARSRSHTPQADPRLQYSTAAASPLVSLAATDAYSLRHRSCSPRCVALGLRVDRPTHSSLSPQKPSPQPGRAPERSFSGSFVHICQYELTYRLSRWPLSKQLAGREQPAPQGLLTTALVANFRISPSPEKSCRPS
jgi:hypothetical protein